MEGSGQGSDDQDGQLQQLVSSELTQGLPHLVHVQEFHGIHHTSTTDAGQPSDCVRAVVMVFRIQIPINYRVNSVTVFHLYLCLTLIVHGFEVAGVSCDVHTIPRLSPWFFFYMTVIIPISCVYR